VTARPSPRAWSAVVLDIEGTTTPIAFVHEVLFPYARARLTPFLATHAARRDVTSIVSALWLEHRADVAGGEAPPPWVVERDPVGPVPYLEWLMDRDRKSPGLKALQGLIWDEGYAKGELRGQVFPDVPAALARWRAAGLGLAIYSSGSVLAQRRLFQSTEAGDLSAHIDDFFDTGVGPKREPDSYRRIAAAMGRPASDILFISDVTAELAAARAAGFRTRLSIRPGNPAQPDATHFTAITDFDGL
jgi:enolase-phosphatase E1